MKLWPFSRKKTDQEVPQEIQEYYQAERRVRAGMAWLLAGVTLVVTLLLATGLFFGGRWAYRAIFNNDEEQTTQQEQGTDETSEANEAPSTQSPATLPSGNADQPNEEPAERPATTPATGPTLPETGPSDNL
jgi:uncharacterized protein HemX